MKGQGNSFDDEWKDAFDGAELEPNSNVWAGLDKHLADKEISILKNRLFYWRVAAAVLLLFFATGSGIWWMGTNAVDGTNLAQQTSNPSTSPSQPFTTRALSSTQEQVGSVASTASPESAQAARQRSEASAKTLALANGDATLTQKPEVGKETRSPIQQRELAENESDLSERAVQDDLKTLQGEIAPNGRKPRKVTGDSVKSSPALAIQVPVDKPTSRKSRTGNKSALYNTPTTSTTLATTKARNTSIKNLSEDSQEQNRLAGKSLSVNEQLLTQRKSAPGQKPEKESDFLTMLSPLAVHVDDSSVLENGLANKKLASFQKESIWRDQPLEKEEEPKQSSVWTSLAFSPTYFNSNLETNYQPTYSNVSKYAAFNSPNSVTTARSVQTPKDVNSPNFSYSVAMQVGKDLSKKWMVISGIQYQYNDSRIQTSTYAENTVTNEKQSFLVAILNNSTADAATFDIATKESLGSSLLLNNPQESSNITIRNQYQYIGIPLKVGYRINPDKKLVLSTSAGVSTNLFLRNKLSGRDDNVSSSVIKAGDNSAYRLVNLSALFSVGINYRYSNQLSIMLEPAYNTALYSATKSSSSVRSFPMSIGIGAGVKYNFK